MIKALAFVGIPQRFTDDPPGYARPEIIGVVKTVDRIHHLVARQARILQVRQLMAARVRQGLASQKTFFIREIVEFRSRIGMGQRNLNGFAIELFGVFDCCFDGLPSLARQSDNEVTVNFDARALAVLDKGAAHFYRGALLDIFQNLRIAGFKSDN